jgi:hypothetical protein
MAMAMAVRSATPGVAVVTSNHASTSSRVAVAIAVRQ